MVKIGGSGDLRGISKVIDISKTLESGEIPGKRKVAFEKIGFEKVLFDKLIGIGKVPSVRGFFSPPKVEKLNVENLSGDENRMILRRFLIKENRKFTEISGVMKSGGNKEKFESLVDVAKMVSVLNELSKLHDDLLLKLVVEKNV